MSCSNNRTHEEAAAQAERLHLCKKGSGVQHVLLPRKNCLLLEDGKLETDIERDRDEMSGLGKVLDLVGM